MDEQIEKTIGKYVEGARTGDPDLMRDAFLTEATVRGSYGGKPVDWTLQEFCDLIAKGGPAPDLEATDRRRRGFGNGRDGASRSRELARHPLHGFLRAAQARRRMADREQGVLRPRPRIALVRATRRGNS